MQKLSFVIGVTATGKTYFIENSFKDKNVEILNIYDYQIKVYDEEGYNDSIPIDAEFRCLKKANDMFLHDIIEKLKDGKNVVAEHTLYKAKRRIAYIDEIRKAADVNIEVYVMCPTDILWEENIKKRKLLKDFNGYKREYTELFEFPNLSEGFDDIYEVSDGKVFKREDPLKPEIVEKARKEIKEENERIFKENKSRMEKDKLIKSMNTRPFWHYCEVCGKKEFITAQEAFDKGWDYPPRMGFFGLLSPRKCGKCSINDTLYWKLIIEDGASDSSDTDLTPDELITLRRIQEEPESLIETEEE